uniref:DUF4220 domain-containing protein n=1 Tax=Arundo donax TaxID=35708 RepID=A0A0A8XNJ4_ARUDO
MILSDMSLFAAANDLKKRRKNQGQDQILAPLSPGTEMSSKRWLRKAFGLIYTRANVINTPAYLAYHLLLVPLLHIAAITLFATSHKNVYEATDVKMTYIFLGFTAALDVLAVFIRQLLFQIMGSAGVAALCETLPGHNLIASVVRRIHPVSGGLLKCVTSIGCKEDYFICEDDSLYRKVAGLVLVDLMSAPRLKGLDLGTYRSFTRANWALSMELQKACNMGRTDNDAISHSISGSPQADLVQEATNQTIHESEIQRSLRKESFDESVLLWHIATDLCFRKMPQPEGKLREVCTQAISNYMAHLLNFRPEMLMTGSRQHLFTEAIGNVESILGKGFQYHYTAGDDEILVKKIMDEADKAEAISIYPLIHDACKLAKDLIQLQDETRWELMYRVWLGMICYSASMCRGYLHAKTLGEGGEFLSFVWLVLSLKGAKTLADKLQMPELDPGEEPQVEETPTATPDLYSELLAAL